MKDPLVSVITPCYNGAEFIDQYFQSILSQTYTHLELIFVNDGSQDETEQIALSYRDQLESKGISFHYIYQENQGQAAAVNQGLKIFQGDYFIWPDSDDILSPDSIEKRVNFLEENPQFSMVRSNADFFDYQTKKWMNRASEEENRFHTDIFMDLILEESFCFCGCYMVKKDAFLSIYPERQIPTSSAGQNWQILIPLAGRFQCGFIDEDLYHIAARNGSHSRHPMSYEEKIQRQLDLKELLLSVIEISGRKDQDYSAIIDVKYMRRLFDIAISEKEYIDARMYYQQLREAKAVTRDNRGKYLDAFYPNIGKIYHLWRRGCAKIKRMMGTNHS